MVMIMRLIDADKMNLLLGISDRDIYAKMMLDHMDTVDAVPVTRCKGCQYWQDNNGGYPNEECRWREDETPDADDFCSYGKRKDGDNNVHSDQRPEKRN